MLFENWRIKSSAIRSHMERMNTRKRNTINTVQCSKSSKIDLSSKINKSIVKSKSKSINP